MSTVFQKIREQIKRTPEGKPFHASSLRHLGLADNVRQILSRMVKNNEIARVSRGIFVRPKQISHVGEIMPSTQEIAETVANLTGETIAIHGAEAARRLSLTTQTPVRPIFYTSGNSRQIKSKNLTITLKHISHKKLALAGTVAGSVLSALWYLGKNNVTPKTIETIEKKLTKKQFNQVLNSKKYMPAWMANSFFHYQRYHKK